MVEIRRQYEYCNRIARGAKIKDGKQVVRMCAGQGKLSLGDQRWVMGAQLSQLLIHSLSIKKNINGIRIG